MTHRRRLTRGLPPARKAQGWMPVEVLASEKQTPTVVIPAVTPEPAQTEVIATDEITPGQAARIHEGIEAAIRSEYARESVPDLGSPDPADRTEYLRELGSDEFVFESVVGDLDARYLLDTSLPVPPRTAAPDPSPEDIPPPAGAPSAPGAPGLGTDTDPGASPAGEDRDQTSPDAPEPVQDEPEAEHDCGETGEVA